MEGLPCSRHAIQLNYYPIALLPLPLVPLSSRWYSFTSLMRIYKHYTFALSNPAVKSQAQSFSSYPGACRGHQGPGCYPHYLYRWTAFMLSILPHPHCMYCCTAGMLSSMDDFYVLDSKMVVTETSNDVYDMSLYRLATNQAALSWHREWGERGGGREKGR